MSKRQISREFLRFLLVVTGLFALMGCAGAWRQRPQITLSFDRGETSSAELFMDDDRAVIDVIDSPGINGLTARLETGKWPEVIIVRLPLNGLERLEIHYGDYTITTGRSSNESPDPPLMLFVQEENGQVSQAPPSAYVYYPDIRRSNDGFEISLPPHFFQGDHPSFSLQWIDFFRQ